MKMRAGRVKALGGLLVIVLSGAVLFISAPAALAVSGPQNFPNSRIADVALRYVGQSRATGFNQPGECVKWVQSWVAEAGGNMPGGNPVSLYRNAGAAEIQLDQAQRGDIFQISRGDTWNGSPHTGVFTSARQGDGAFDIVAGNVPAGSGKVVTSHYRPSAPAGHELHVWRFGRDSGATVANGSFLRGAETGRVYRVVGGAPLWLSSCVEGCPGLVNLSQSTIDAMPTVPSNGSFLRAVETGRVYRVVGGAPLWLSFCVDGCPGMVNVNQWTVDALDHLHDVPDNGSFLRGAETGRVYRVVGGAPLWLSFCVDGCPGLVNVSQWTVDALNHLRAVPDNGSFLRGAETGRVYRVAGGAPLWLCTCVDGCPGLVNVSQWTVDALDHLRAVPSDGTLLRAIETGRIYQVNGGVPTWLSSCPPQGCGGYVQVNQWTIDVRDHLRS
jgi:hypothetical protein